MIKNIINYYYIMPIYQPSNDAFSLCSFSTDGSKKCYTQNIILIL